MFELILMVTLTNAQPVQQTAKFKPCVWPNRCEKVEVAQFRPCVWPNKCEQQPIVG